MVLVSTTPPPTGPPPWQLTAPPQHINHNHNSSVPSNDLAATMDYLHRQLEIIDAKLTILGSKPGARSDPKSPTTTNPKSHTRFVISDKETEHSTRKLQAFNNKKQPPPTDLSGYPGKGTGTTEDGEDRVHGGRASPEA